MAKTKAEQTKSDFKFNKAMVIGGATTALFGLAMIGGASEENAPEQKSNDGVGYGIVIAAAGIAAAAAGAKGNKSISWEDAQKDFRVNSFKETPKP